MYVLVAIYIQDGYNVLPAPWSIYILVEISIYLFIYTLVLQYIYI